MLKRVIQWAPREKRRAVFAAVGRSFVKTITEPITNSDSALKKQAGVAHAAGLVDQLLNLKVDDRLNSADLKKKIPKRHCRQIVVRVHTSGRKSRFCSITDSGPGMTAAELEANFGQYANAKAKGERTRSLFGRGALDVLLYHEGSTIYSVKNGRLSRCRIYWENDALCEIEDLGAVSEPLLNAQKLPRDILSSGTFVSFTLKEGTPILQEDQIVSRLSSFYMLRLIAADPNSRVELIRHRADGSHASTLSYDLPIGTVVGRGTDALQTEGHGQLPVDILVARADVPLEGDPDHIDRRENGLLFVDDNDAVLDLTLLPEYDRNPYLKHIYGVVRITGIRSVLESYLEAEDAVAVLTSTRDGFERKNPFVVKLFELIERHVKPLYEAEERSQRKGDTHRSGNLDQRVREVLKVINQFNSEETDEVGGGDPPPRPPKEAGPIYFSVATARLHTGIGRTAHAYVDRTRVKSGEIVLFESDNAEIEVEPDSGTITAGEGYQRIDLKITCSIKDQRGTITGLTLDNEGGELRASMEIVGVDDPPVLQPPTDIAFSASRFSSVPNRTYTAALLVNLTAFPGMPVVTFWLEEVEGHIVLADGQDALTVKVTAEHVMTGSRIARLSVPFRGSGWGQRATLRAKAKRSDGKYAYAKCRLKLERSPGNEAFRDFHYEDLARDVLGDVAGDKLYINAGYALHRQIFGDTESEFNTKLETDPIAQMRAASVLVDVVVYRAATIKHSAGGKKGLHIKPEDPIGSLRPYIDESRMKLEPRLIRALAPQVLAAGVPTSSPDESQHPSRGRPPLSPEEKAIHGLMRAGLSREGATAIVRAAPKTGETHAN
ncbi:MAG: hypothetical protein ABSH00_04380 [Bryobacteraceae bacterium]|jgi:hypothetical protein